MNIHEYQAKALLAEYGVPIPIGNLAYSPEQATYRAIEIGGDSWLVKAQVHSGARGKAGGIKFCSKYDEVGKAADELLGAKLVTHQTGPEGKEVKRIYIEEASDIHKEYYLSCLVDRESSKIAFISSTEGGMDIEKVSKETPNKIITNKVEVEENISSSDIEKIIKPFNFSLEQKKMVIKL